MLNILQKYYIFLRLFCEVFFLFLVVSVELYHHTYEIYFMQTVKLWLASNGNLLILFK